MIKITRELLDRYHEERCTEEEQAAVEIWLNEPHSDLYLPKTDRLKQLEEEIWKGIVPETSRKPRVSVFIGVAAMLVLCCGIGLWQHRLAPIAQQTLHVAYGKKVKTKLPDGTKVYLNAGSILRYPKRFEGNSRKVTLVGEAYFDVYQDAETPFYVEAGEAQVKVLGTRFNIKAYPEEDGVYVAVEQGKIQFSEIGKGPGLILKAQQQALLRQHQLLGSRLPNAVALAWKDQVLYFDNTTLQEVIPVLERWYNIQIELKDKHLGEQRWSGSFQNPSLHKLLHFLRTTMNISYTLHDHTLILFEE